MFENIKPTDTMIEVALPYHIMSQLSDVFYYANIKEKGFTMCDEKFGLALARKKASSRAPYVPVQKKWHEKWVERYPDVDKEDIPMSYFHNNISQYFETYGYCKINISEEDVWKIVDILVYNKESDPDVLTARKNKKEYNERMRKSYNVE